MSSSVRRIISTRFDHVADDLPRRVPDAHLLSKFRVEGLEEGLVEVLDRLTTVESLEKVGSVDTVQCFASAIEDAHEVERR